MSQVESLAKEMLEFHVQQNPVMATYLGMHQHDHRLPEMSLAWQRRGTRAAREALERLRNIAPQAEERVDWLVLEHSLELELLYGEEIQMWRTAPGAAGILGSSLFPLLTREFAPLETRLEGMVSRLKEGGRMLEASRELVDRPVKIRVESALMGAAGLPLLFKTVAEAAAGTPVKERAADAAAAAKEAVGKQVDWMKSLLPQAEDRFAIGEELLVKLLFRRGIQMSPEALVLFGKLKLHDLKVRARELAGVPFGGDYLPAAKELKTRRPADFDSALDAYRKSVAEAREFVIRERVAAVPGGEKCEVMRTPDFMKPLIPFAAYFSPARYDPVQHGIYIVTDAGPESLDRHDWAGIINTSVHEAYPGHHLQLCWAHRHPSTARLFAHATEMVEGWAHYCEEMMGAHGFKGGKMGESSPTIEKDLELTRVLDLIWRADRVIIDMLLHQGKLSFEQAVDLLVRDAGMSKPAAESEVRRYASSPGQPFSYLYGKEEIKAMRAEWEKRLGAKFDETRFHEAILKAGSLPLSIMREELKRVLGAG